MSLLVPTINDFHEAHPPEEVMSVVRDHIKNIQTERDESGQLSNPWLFEPVPGFFKQCDDATDDLNFNYMLEDFGIKKPWAEIIDGIHKLNEAAQHNESYKLLFLARHGQGYHNVVISKYGIEEWCNKWYSLETDGELIYAPDPYLTELGVNQAKENNLGWKDQLKKGAPLPQRFYVSPMTRSSLTVMHTWNDIALAGSDKKNKVIVKEKIRETLGVNLCDKRSTKTIISERFSKYGYEFEDGFTEEDECYKDDYREKPHEHAARVHDFLQELFEKDWDHSSKKIKEEKDVFVSTTSHSGTIKAFITVLGHRAFTIPTGSMIPVVVKATRRNE